MANIIETFPKGGGGASSLSQLTDVQLSNLQDGEVLKYNGTSGKFENAEDAGGQTIQYDTLPTADADHVGQIVQYVGASTSTLIKGRFYECISDGAATPTYSWSELKVEKDEIRKMSLHDFENLSQEEKDNGQAYFIPDVFIPADGMPFSEIEINENQSLICYKGQPMVIQSRNGSAVNLYVDSVNGRDTLEDAWGFSAAKPFKTLQYVYLFVLKSIYRGYRYNNTIIHILGGTYNSSNAGSDAIEIGDVWIRVEQATTINNIRIGGRGTFRMELNADLTMNQTVEESNNLLEFAGANVHFSGTGKLTVNQYSKTATRSYTFGGGIVANWSSLVSVNNSGGIEVNHAIVAAQASNGSTIYLRTLSGTDNGTGIMASGGFVTYGTKTISATTATKQTNGGRIFTGES